MLTREGGERVTIEVHDSGPGLGEEVSDTLFEPTINFKKHGMGLGLLPLCWQGSRTKVARRMVDGGFRLRAVP